MLARIATWVSAAALLAFLAGAVRLGQLERGGPPHADLVLEGGTPATLYLPEAAGEGAFLDPPPRDERPPGVVLLHGFASSRAFTSSLARRLALAGYAVLAPDARGHGANRNPFPSGRGRADLLASELAAAVDFLRASPFVDGSRLALMGHSMGAGAALDYATRDSGLDATVLIAGGWALQGPYRPPNALFVFAESDSPRVQERSRALAAELAGLERVEDGRVYGEVALGTAVRALRIPGTDHGRILWSREAVAEILAWLDAVFGRDASRVAPDPRLGLSAALLGLAVLVLPGLGLAVGRLVPRPPPLPAGGRALGLAALAGALALCLPLLSPGALGAALPLEVADRVFAGLGLAGAALLALLAVARRDPVPLFPEWRRALPGAALGLAGVYALLQPLGVAVSPLLPTPERALVFALSTLVLLPFALAFQALLRRGPPLEASAFALAGRVLVLAALLGGVAAGVVGRVVVLMLPALALVFAMAEIAASAIYARSRNLVAIALLDASWLALVLVSSLPLRI